MRMADRTGESIGGIRRGVARQREQPPHHVLNLLLARMAVADYRLLYLEGCVLRYRKAGKDGGTDGRAASLPESERGLRVHIYEYLLHGDFDRAVRRDHFLEPLEDRLQARGQSALSGLHAAARNVMELASRGLDHAEPGNLQSRIDAEDSQSITAVV